MASIVTGHFLKAGEQLQITLEARRGGKQPAVVARHAECSCSEHDCNAGTNRSQSTRGAFSGARVKRIYDGHCCATKK